jgi:tetratricopeptide (TPR) repeat protein
LTTLKVTLDSSFYNTIHSGRFQPSFDYLYHYPDKKDELRYKKYKHLIGQQPTSKNYELYYSLTCSLWDLEKTQEAENMFLTILNSNEKYYLSTYYHSSDIPGDTTTNIYGYGSFTSNYKNYSAIYLTKIYLEQKKFDKALQYLEEAVKKHKVTYNCGTGYQRQQDEYDFLYASCYLGLQRHKEVIDLLLPACLERNDTILVSAIRNTYSDNDIQEYLDKAEISITCSLDTFPSYAYQTTYGDNKKELTDTLEYYSGSATILLFDKQVIMPVPSLENKQRLTREMFLTLFKESDFYDKLRIKK